MTVEQLQKTRNAFPFQPFTIQLPNGRAFHVPHRDFLAMPDHGRTATVWNKNGNAYSIIDVMRITELAMDPEPSASASSQIPLPPHQDN